MFPGTSAQLLKIVSYCRCYRMLNNHVCFWNSFWNFFWCIFDDVVCSQRICSSCVWLRIKRVSSQEATKKYNYLLHNIGGIYKHELLKLNMLNESKLIYDVWIYQECISIFHFFLHRNRLTISYISIEGLLHQKSFNQNDHAKCVIKVFMQKLIIIIFCKIKDTKEGRTLVIKNVLLLMICFFVWAVSI